MFGRDVRTKMGAAGFRVGCLLVWVLKHEEVPDFWGSRAVLRALTVLWVRWGGEEFYGRKT